MKVFKSYERSRNNPGNTMKFFPPNPYAQAFVMYNKKQTFPDDADTDDKNSNCTPFRWFKCSEIKRHISQA